MKNGVIYTKSWLLSHTKEVRENFPPEFIHYITSPSQKVFHDIHLYMNYKDMNMETVVLTTLQRYLNSFIDSRAKFDYRVVVREA